MAQPIDIDSLNHWILDGLFTRSDGTQQSFADLTYLEYFTLFRLANYDLCKIGQSGYYVERTAHNAAPPKHVILRSASRPHVCRIQPARPSEGERFYLRAILQHRPARGMVDARTVEGSVKDTYQEAATAMGLFAHEKEAEYALMEAIENLSTPRQLRVLFVHLLVNDCVTGPRRLWDTFEVELARDYILQHGNVHLVGIDHALDEIGRYLEEYGKTLQHYGLPEPIHYSAEVEHELAQWVGHEDELFVRAQASVALFNAEQRQVYDAIVEAATSQTPLLAFVDGQAGRGKTFLVNAICDYLRAIGLIVIPTATAGYAAQLYPGGRTTHSAFKVPVNESSEMLRSPIQSGSPRANLIKESSVVIWDEAPMANRAVLACVDETMRTACNSNLPFGGKVVVLLGDFRQTCPVVRRGTREQTVAASIKSSPLWPLFTIFRLTIPIRNAEDPDFAAFVDAIGDGAGPEVNVQFLANVPNEHDLIDFTFPDAILMHPLTCCRRAILAPTNAQIDNYNNEIIERIHGNARTYFAADSLKEAEEAGVEMPDSILDYVARHTPPGMPPHTVNVKTNAVYRLLRNFSLDRGLVKNVRAVVTDVGVRLVTVRLVRPTTNGIANTNEEDILIPRISFSTTLQSGHTLLRRQFPLAPAYATTFNSCQGLTLDRVGVDLTKPVFSHGQLYTALSRIRHRSHARVRLPAGECTTTNVTYEEILV